MLLALALGCLFPPLCLYCKRRRGEFKFQFSLRSLLIAMLTIGAVFAFIRDDLQPDMWYLAWLDGSWPEQFELIAVTGFKGFLLGGFVTWVWMMLKPEPETEDKT
ncbi:MAG: hypothetical protein N2C14_22730, partial [Planctomycetales bacterium]